MRKNNHLLRSRRFAPLFWTQFLGAFNDNVFKNALVILITFKIATDVNEATLVVLSGGLFILPFFLFSAIAGQIADKYERSRLLRIIKFAEIMIMTLGAIAFYFSNLVMLMAVLFLMGTQSSFFGPIKYSIIPQLLKEDELLYGNGLVSMATFISILLGTLAGGIIIAQEPNGTLWLSITVILIAILGWLSSLFIPRAASPDPQLVIRYNLVRETIRIIRFAQQNRMVFYAILGISWFWGIGLCYLAILPTFSKYTLQGDAYLTNFFLTMFSLGIGIGALLCKRLAKAMTGIGLIIPGALGISLFSIMLFIASSVLPLAGSNILSLPMFSIGLIVLLIGLFGGLYIVPLYVILQSMSEITHRSRIIAANNIFNTLTMVVVTLATIVAIESGITEKQLFAVVGTLNLLVILFLSRRLPELTQGFKALIVK